VMPDARIVEWNESNYDLGKHPYLQMARQARKWAFASDYARLDIVSREGGIYLDVDVELLRPLDPLLDDSAFCGTEPGGHVATGLILAAEKGHPLVCAMRDDYDRLDRLTPCPEVQTEFLKCRGYCPSEQQQCIEGLTIYPARYFAPMDYRHGRCVVTSDTYSVHHYGQSWQPLWIRGLRGMRIACERIFGERIAHGLTAVKRVVYRGGCHGDS